MEGNSKYQRAFLVASGRMFYETCVSVMNVMCILGYDEMVKD